MEPEKNRKYRIYDIFRLCRRAFWKYKKQIVIITILGFLCGALEGIGVNALIPLVSFFTKGGNTGNDIISKFIMNTFSFFHITPTLISLLILICVLFILKSVVLFVSNYIKIKITSDFEKDTRNELLRYTLEANWPHLMKQKIGYLETVILTDTANSAGIFRIIGTSVISITGLLIYLTIAVNISFVITIVTISIGGILIFFLKPLLRRVRELGKSMSKINKEVSHFINEHIIGIKTIKSIGAEKEVELAGVGYFSRLQDYKIRHMILSTLATLLIQPISILIISVLIVTFYYSQSFNLGALAALVYLINRIFIYIQNIQSYLQQISHLFPFLQSMLNYKNAMVGKKEEDKGKSNFFFDQEFAFKNVLFSYTSNQASKKYKEVLKNISFSVKKGELVGLIGPSGEGKTTIVDLCLKLLQPTDGEILVDGRNINEIKMKEWRKHVGYVSQDIFLLNDTVENNIRFYDNSISDADMIEAAKMANVYDVIKELPDQFSTIIGERGIRLSVGQRQRIVLARILLRKPSVLILDEATSALDNESELQIQKVINELRGKITVLAIAHRLSTILDSDRVFVLKSGEIVEKGVPRDLLRDKNSYYYKLYNIREDNNKNIWT